MPSLLQERGRVQQKASEGAGIAPFRPKAAPDQKLSEIQRRIVSWVQTETDRCRAYLVPFHRQWYINIASELGSIGVQSETIARALRVQIKKPPHRIRHSTNLIGPACRRLAGYLARSNPDMEIASADLDDPLQVDMAHGAQEWVPWHREYEHYRQKELACTRWSVSTGLGVLKAIWDPGGGPMMSAVQDGRPMRDPTTGAPLVDRKGRPLTYPSGMSATKLVPTWNIIYSIESQYEDELNWVGENWWAPFRVLEEIRPGLSDGLQPEVQYHNTTGYYQRQVAQSIGPSGIYAGLAPESDAPGAEITLVYIRPYYLPREEFGTEMYQKGAFAMVSQGRLLVFEPNEFLSMPGVNPRYDWHPYSFFPCYSISGRFLPQGVPENMIPLVDAINFIFSRVREAQRTMGQPKWLLPHGCGITKGMLGPEAGEKVYYNAGIGKPEAWTPPPMPAYVFQMLERAYRDVDLVASQPPMVQGQAQGQIRSGLGVQLLQEQALTDFTGILIDFDEAKRRHTRQLLLREIQNSEMPRTIQYQGVAGWEQESFFAKLMAPDFIIRIKPGTSLPQSKALVMSELDRMVAWGVLQPGANPDHAELVARSMEYNVPPVYPGNELKNLKNAREENARVLLGDETVPISVENHKVHINEHIRFMMAPKFKEWAEADPTLQERLYRHIGHHRFYLMMQASGMDLPQPIPPFDDAQMMMGGGAPGPGAMGMTNRGGGMMGDQLRNQNMFGMEGGGNAQEANSGGQGAGLLGGAESGGA